jgi:hypothetical protein
MSSRPPRKPSGRVAFDEWGNATWEWRGETDRFDRDIETQRLRTLGSDLSCYADDLRAPAPSSDPYNRATMPANDQSRPRKRTLDDLRRLSEEIKAARERKARK